MELGHYREVVDRIRDSGVDVIINLTTGPGGRFIPGKEDPKVAAPGSSLTTPMRRVEHIIALKPEICTLDLNTMWSGTAVVINPPVYQPQDSTESFDRSRPLLLFALWR